MILTAFWKEFYFLRFLDMFHFPILKRERDILPAESVEGQSRVMVTLWLLSFPLPPTYSCLPLTWESSSSHWAATLLLQGPQDVVSLSCWFILFHARVSKRQKTWMSHFYAFYLLTSNMKLFCGYSSWLFCNTSVSGVNIKKMPNFSVSLWARPTFQSRPRVLWGLSTSGSWGRSTTGVFPDHSPLPQQGHSCATQWHLEEKVVGGVGNEGKWVMGCQTWLHHQICLEGLQKLWNLEFCIS